MVEMPLERSKAQAECVYTRYERKFMPNKKNIKKAHKSFLLKCKNLFSYFCIKIDIERSESSGSRKKS
jgi:hypothetical protein